RHHPDLASELTRVLDHRAIDRSDHVACGNAGLRRGAIGLRFGNERAFRLLEAEAIGDLRRDRLDLHAQPGPIDEAMVLELGHDHLCGFGGDIESDTDRTTRRRENGGVYPHYTALHV